MGLQQQLDDFNAKVMGDDSPIKEESRKVMIEFGKELKARNLEAQALTVGQPFPEFSLPTAEGPELSRAQLLAKGPAVALFFRGHW